MMAEETESGISWLQSLARFGIRPGLDRTRRVLQDLNSPQDRLKFLHVAGTNGKGSVCAYLSELLSLELVVAVFTSPSFDGYRGRMQIGQQSINEDEFEMLTAEVREASLRVTRDDPLTEFEALTVIAILYFSRHRVDVVVWETGLGGRYDSTNVVKPVVAAITNIGYDHMEVLGDTLSQIAYDKAGIIKPGVPVVTGAKDDGLRVIESVARSLGAPLCVLSREFASVRHVSRDHTQTVDYRGVLRDWFRLPLTLYGRHQADNAAMALAILELTCKQRLLSVPSAQAVRQALARVAWPLRMEIRDVNGQTVILDGAHNPDGARRLAEALQEFEPGHTPARASWTMVIGVLKDKDVHGMLSPVLPYAARVVVTRPDNVRAKNADLLAKDIRAFRNDIEVNIVSSVSDAFDEALKYKNPICCWGSLYTVHEARNAMETVIRNN